MIYMIYKKYFKRIFDIIFSLVTLIVLFPFLLIIGIIIKIDSKGAIIFTQERVGKNQKKFKMFKFRTMLRFEDSYYEDGTEMENYDRITKVGEFLRKTSIDELPQLLNVLLGDMSIVGPRPTLPYQVEKYDSKQKERLKVRPGLTGLAQINGRNDLSWNEKIKYDLIYVENISFFLDLKIIFKTIFVLFKVDQVSFKKHDDLSEHQDSVLNDIKGDDDK